MHADGKAGFTAADDLQDLVAGALAAHDEGGEGALSAFLSRLGPRAPEVRAILDRFLGLGVLTRPVTPPAMPDRLGEFRLVRRLGAGGMGVVFLAEQASLRREVALKVVRPELLLFEGARERFRREVEAIARLRHPGIVPIVAVGEDGGIPYFAMELIEGRTAEEVTEALAGRDPASLTGEDLWQQVRGPAPAPGTPPAILHGPWWQVVALLCAQTARAMRHAHVAGIVHRDLKPSNIMLTPHGHALVLDFGLARFESGDKITRTGTELGSPAYMSPEQVRGEPLDHRTDVYSLGATLYQLLCLVPPFSGRDVHDLRARILAGAAPAPRSRNRSVPRDLEIVCLKALDLDRARRYASMADFAADLEAAAHGRPIAARRLGLPQRIARWARRHRAAAAALAVGLVFLGLLPGLLALQQQQANRRLQAEYARAQRNLAISTEAIQTMMVRVGEVDLGSVPGAQKVRLRLLEEAVALYERILADPSNDPALRRERAGTLAQLAKMQVELGRYAAAEETVAETIAITGGDSLAVDDEMLGLRTRSRQIVATVAIARGEFDRAVRELTAKRAELAELLRRGNDSAQTRHGMVTTLATLADCARQQGDGSPAAAAAREPLLREALDLLAELLRERPDDPHLVRNRASTLQELAFALQEQERFADAHAVLDEEIALVEPLSEDRNARPRKAELLMLAWSAKGITSFSTEDYPAAVDQHARSVEYAEQLVRDFPDTTSYVSRLGTMLTNLASAHQKLGAHEVAEPLLRRALVQQRTALQRNPDYAEGRRFYLFHLHALARSLRALGRRAELVEVGEDMARSSDRGKEALEAAGMLADACALPAPLAAEPVPFDAAAVAQRAVDLLLEAERRGWPPEVKLDPARFAVLRERPEFAALLQRRGG